MHSMGKRRDQRPLQARLDAVLGRDGKRYAMGAGAAKRITEHLELHDQGLTVRAIAARTGWSYPTVWRDIKQYEPVSRDESAPRETDAQ